MEKAKPQNDFLEYNKNKTIKKAIKDGNFHKTLNLFKYSQSK